MRNRQGSSYSNWLQCVNKLMFVPSAGCKLYISLSLCNFLKWQPSKDNRLITSSWKHTEAMAGLLLIVARSMRVKVRGWIQLQKWYVLEVIWLGDMLLKARHCYFTPVWSRYYRRWYRRSHFKMWIAYSRRTGLRLSTGMFLFLILIFDMNVLEQCLCVNGT